MNILLVSKHFWPENFRINTVIEKLSVDNNIKVLSEIPSYQKKFKKLSHKFNKNVSVLRTWTYPRKKSLISLLLNYLSFSLLGTLKIFQIKFKPDIIFVYATSPIFQAIPAIVYGKINKIPVCIWVQDLWPEVLEDVKIFKDKKILKIINYFVQLVYNYSDYIFVQSKAYKKSIDKRTKKKTILLYNPEEKNKSTLKTTNNKIKIITFAGNIGKAQNLEIIINALKLKKINNVIFHIYGEGNNKKELKKLIIENKLQENIKIFKPVSKRLILEKLNKSDALLITLGKGKALSKTIPAKFQTYISMGKPLIYSGDGELRNFIEKNKIGYTSSSNDIKGLAESIKKLTIMSKIKKKQIYKNSNKIFDRFFELNSWSISLQRHLEKCTKNYKKEV